MSYDTPSPASERDGREREAGTSRGGERTRRTEEAYRSGWLASFGGLTEAERERLVERLDEESLRRVARMFLAGLTCQEMAKELGCVTRTVTRKLDLIRAIWHLEADR